LGEVAVTALRELITSIVYDGRALQERDGSWFNASLLCCLPKSSSGTMDDGMDFYDASNTRPLSVGNTDCRLIAAACRTAWQPLFQARVDPHQRGFLPHRSMAANIYEVDEALRTEACLGQDSAAIFWDWAAAFPSIDRGFLLAALRAQGLPRYAMALIEGLYTRTTCQVVHGGFRHAPFEATKGIRQGCPLSPLLFVLATSELTSCLSSLPGVTARTYADDCATVLRSWDAQEPAVRQVFEDFAAATGMQINWRKSVVVPLRREAWDPIRLDLAQRPLDSRLPMADTAKYLGLYLGPGAKDTSWKGPVRKMQQRLHDWDWRNAGLMTAIRIFNTYLLSTLSYVGQFLPPPQWVLDEVAKAAQRVVGGPAGAFDMVELPILREQYHWPAPLGDLRVTSRASQLRLWHWENRHHGGLQIAAALQRMAAAQAATDYIPDDAPHFLWWHSPLHRYLQAAFDTLASEGVTLRSITAAMFPRGVQDAKQVRQLRRGTQRMAIRLQLRSTFQHRGDGRLRRRLENILPAGNFPRPTTDAGGWSAGADAGSCGGFAHRPQRLVHRSAAPPGTSAPTLLALWVA
jgi:hypothetical protein